MLKEYLSTLANRFRTILGTTEPINAQDFVTNIGSVYDKGTADGWCDAELYYTDQLEKEHIKGVNEGKQAEYDHFWDTYQENGTRTKYGYAFCGIGWNKETFKPKYPIYVSNYCFYTINQVEPCGTNTAVDFSDVVLDGSKATTAHYLFANSNCKNITVDLSNCTNLTSPFTLSGGGYLDNLTIKVSKALKTVQTPFSNAWTLKELRFMEGSEIACNNFNFQWSSSLTAESIRSIINALSPDTGGLTITLSLNAVKKAFETSSGANDGNTSTEWLNLSASRPRWTITLV